MCQFGGAKQSLMQTCNLADSFNGFAFFRQNFMQEAQINLCHAQLLPHAQTL